MKFALTTAVGCLAAILLNSCASKTDRSGAPEKKAPAPTKVEAKATVAASTKASEAIECVTGSDKRQIELFKDSNGCEVKYTKFGESKVAASAKNDEDHCTGIYQRIKGNLESAGFVCR